MNQVVLNNAILLIARILLSLMFIVMGSQKVIDYAGTVAFMAQAGVPGVMLPLVIATELGCGLLILLGLWTRVAAFLLAGYCLLTGAMFHFHPGDNEQMINFMKNASLAGGFLALMSAGAGGWSIDALMRKK